MALVANSRREFLAAMAAGLAMPVMGSAPAAAADEPMRFAHAFGETVVPKPATRVVSIGYTTQDALLALGIIPLGIRDWFGNQPYGVFPWAQPLLNGAKPALMKGGVSLEIVAALKPDLIVAIGSGISEAEYAALSKVAPVLLQPKDAPSFGMAWDEMTRLIGQATGKAALADELVAKTRQDLAAVQARHPDWKGKTAVAAYHWGADTGIFSPLDTRGRTLIELGFTPPAAVQELDKAGGFYHRLPPEDLSALEADLIIWVASSQHNSDLASLPMRKLLKAHQAGREVMATGAVAAAMSFGSILSLPFFVSQLEADIAAAADGDPETPVASAVKAGLAP